jgi:hypothetical protein
VQTVKYDGHRHDGILKPGEQFDPMGEAPPELREVLNRKGFSFQLGPDYYSFGKDDDWIHDPAERPLISVYSSGTWDGRPVPGYPMKPGTELKDYLESLPDVT